DGAVSDTTPPLNKILPRTRQTTPSPRTSQLRNFIPHAPFVVPFWAPQTQVPTRKVVPVPRTPVPTVPLVQAFFCRATSPFPALPFYTPSVATFLRRRPLGGEVEKIIVGCKDHQHYNYREPNPKSHLLSAIRQRFSPHRFDRVVQQVTTIE